MPNYIKISDSTNTTSSITAASSTAIKSVMDNVTNNYAKKSEITNKFVESERGQLDIDTLYNCKVYMIGSGTNLPSGSQFGSVLVLPYRTLNSNTTPDFGAQIFIPNGDDKTKSNSLFYRTSLKESWNEWREVASFNTSGQIVFPDGSKFWIS